MSALLWYCYMSGTLLATAAGVWPWGIAGVWGTAAGVWGTSAGVWGTSAGVQTANHFLNKMHRLWYMY